MILVKSIKDVKELVLEFPFPDLHEFYRKNPSKIMAHLIGHEGDGSILAELKRKGWALELSAGLQGGGNGFSFFKINVEMTDQGLENYEAIIFIIFQYVLMMKNQLSMGVLKWIYHECQLLGEISFKFKEQVAPSRYTSRLANQMHDFYLTDILSGPYLLKDFDPELIKNCMQYLGEDNFRFIILARHSDITGSWAKAEHYGTEHQILEFSNQLKESLCNISESDRLHLPRKNEFLPENLSVQRHTESPVTSPSIFKESPILRIWYKKDGNNF
jgi:insulysin